jgi:hypothetical protein
MAVAHWSGQLRARLRHAATPPKSTEPVGIPAPEAEELILPTAQSPLAPRQDEVPAA